MYGDENQKDIWFVDDLMREFRVESKKSITRYEAAGIVPPSDRQGKRGPKFWLRSIVLAHLAKRAADNAERVNGRLRQRRSRAARRVS